jgi:hypothetical protein
MSQDIGNYRDDISVILLVSHKCAYIVKHSRLFESKMIMVFDILLIFWIENNIDFIRRRVCVCIATSTILIGKTVFGNAISSWAHWSPIFQTSNKLNFEASKKFKKIP